MVQSACSRGRASSNRTTYTLTAWRSAEDMGRWLRTPYHARLMRDFAGRLESSAAVGWLTDAFEPRAAWVEGMKRLKASVERRAPAAAGT